jgi:similar to UDP-N-acetylmuramate:L-alanine ligase murC
MTKIGFCAVSGNGMSPLAQIMKLNGHEVYGSDSNFDHNRDAMRKRALTDVGIVIRPQDGSMVNQDGIEVLIVSSAIAEDNPDVIAAKAKNIPIKKRSELLAEIFHQYRYGIAVGGTSGKSTTTAMIGFILDRLGKNPCMVDGAFLKNYQNRPGLPNFIYNEGDICVIEADESDGSIRGYRPYIGLINNISHDHEPIEVLMEYFQTFANHCQKLIINADCPNAAQIRHPNIITYSVKDKNAGIYAANISAQPLSIRYTLDGRIFKLPLIGRFNVYNALAAIAACSALGIDKFEAARTLEDFLGVQRRLELVGTKNRISVFIDFAHNAEKIKATLSALKEFPGRLIVMYQSHKPLSARTTGEEDGVVFGKYLSQHDILLMPEIYMRDPVKDSDISAADLIRYAQENGVANAFFYPEKEMIRSYILQNALPGDRIVIMGARDNSLPQFCRDLLKDL